MQLDSLVRTTLGRLTRPCQLDNDRIGMEHQITTPHILRQTTYRNKV